MVKRAKETFINVGALLVGLGVYRANVGIMLKKLIVYTTMPMLIRTRVWSFCIVRPMTNILSSREVILYIYLVNDYQSGKLAMVMKIYCGCR